MLASIAIVTILFSGQNGIFVPKVTAVEAQGSVGVYWDPAATNSCRSIYWGQLSPGSRKTVVVYLKNEGNESIFYLLTTKQWYPANASNYITLKSDYDGTRASSGSILPVSLTLLISPEILGIVDFSFDIIIKGSRNLLGDINEDGTVDIFDTLIVSNSYGSTPGNPNWNPNADVEQDNIIDMFDVVIIAINFGKTWTP